MENLNSAHPWVKKRRCIVRGCVCRHRGPVNPKSVRFFWVPREYAIRQQYTVLAGYSGSLPQRAVICSIHFQETDFNSCGQLKPGTRPTLYLPTIDPEACIHQAIPLPSRKRGTHCVVFGCPQNTNHSSTEVQFIPCTSLPVGDNSNSNPIDSVSPYYAWNALCGNPNWAESPPSYLMCSEHFNPNSIDVRFRVPRLRKDALPALNLPTEPPGLHEPPLVGREASEDLLCKEILRRNAIELSRDAVSEFLQCEPIMLGTNVNPETEIMPHSHASTANKGAPPPSKRARERKSSEKLLFREFQKIFKVSLANRVIVTAARENDYSTVSPSPECSRRVFVPEGMQGKNNVHRKLVSEERLLMEIKRKKRKRTNRIGQRSTAMNPLLITPRILLSKKKKSGEELLKMEIDRRLARIDRRVQQVQRQNNMPEPLICSRDLLRSSDPDLNGLLQKLSTTGRWIAPKPSQSEQPLGNVLLVWQPDASSSLLLEAVQHDAERNLIGLPLSSVTASTEQIHHSTQVVSVLQMKPASVLKKTRVVAGKKFGKRKRRK